MQEGHEYDFIESIGICNYLSVMRFAQVLYPARQVAYGHEFAGHPYRLRRQMVVAFLIMFGEGFVTALKFLVQLLAATLPGFLSLENGAIVMSEDAIVKGEIIRPAGAQGNFDAFNRVQQEQAQRTVELINCKDVRKSGVVTELVFAILVGNLVRQPVGAQPVVVDVRQVMLCLIVSGNFHAALCKELDLVTN